MRPPADPDQGFSLASRLEAARRRRFVGREAELALFRSALLESGAPFAVLQIFGPGGVGKSALLREYARIAAECGRPCVQLDGRNIDPSPQGFMSAAREALVSRGAPTAPIEPDFPPAGVWLIDTFEALSSLDAWLRETFLPRLPARSVIVIAGRDPPSAPWSTDLDWADLSRVVALGNLRPEESQTFLATRGIPEEQHDNVLAFTHGHPLALALVSDALHRGDAFTPFDPQSEPDVVRVLLERLVDDTPDAGYRRALEVCVLARITTEALLTDVLEAPDGHALFAWLRKLSLIERGPQGIYPHDLARDVLDADLRWRNPDSHRDLVQRLSAHYYKRLRQARGAEQQRIWFEIIFLNRKNPYYRPYYVWEALGSAYAEPASAADHEAIAAMVRRHQGDDAASIARYWLERQPDAFLVYRAIGGEAFGFMAHLALQDASAEDMAADPAVSAALAFAEEHGPVRPGETLSYVRFWMHRDMHQDVSPAINLTATNASIHWTTNPNLAWSFVATVNPEFMEPQFTSIHIWRSPDADFEMGGQRYGVFTHDWRAEPAAEWLQVKADLALTTERDLSPPGTSAAPFAVLSREAFGEAVRQALRDFAHRDRLAANPLLRTRAVAGEGGAEPSPARLQNLLREAAATLTRNPKDVKFHRALWHTYFEPAPTQERAAELLDIPFNTYRYHLARGIECITGWLWFREVPGDED